MKIDFLMVIAFISTFIIYELGTYFKFDQNLTFVLAMLSGLFVVFFPHLKLHFNRNKTVSLQKDLHKLGLNINQDKIRKFLKDNYGEKEITPSNYKYLLIDLMIENKLGFSVDWKWTPSDILFGIKGVLPKFSFVVQKESEPLEKKIFFKGKILEEEMEFFTPNDKPIEFIAKIRNKIERLTNKKIREFESHGDDYVFLLVPKN